MTHSAWILNASPLILLAKIGQAELLLTLPSSTHVPRSVAQEILQGPSDDPARLLIEQERFPIVDDPPFPPEVLAWDLGMGETAVISYALKHPGSVAILDDMAARKCARSFGIPVKGTLGIIVLAKRKGLILSAATLFHDLLSAGARLDEALARRVLHEIGEEWP